MVLRCDCIDGGRVLCWSGSEEGKGRIAKKAGDGRNLWRMTAATWESVIILTLSNQARCYHTGSGMWS